VRAFLIEEQKIVKKVRTLCDVVGGGDGEVMWWWWGGGGDLGQVEDGSLTGGRGVAWGKGRVQAAALYGDGGQQGGVSIWASGPDRGRQGKRECVCVGGGGVTQGQDVGGRAFWV